MLCLPRRFRRFAGPVTLPDLPTGVEVLWTEEDQGPATKALAPARALADAPLVLIYCDDDWIMQPGWAAALLRAGDADTAATGAGFDVDRLKRCSPRAPEPGFCDIAQGFAGVSIRPDWLAGADCAPPPEAWAVDDIWLSAQLARQGIAIRVAPEARDGMRLAFEDGLGLQDARIGHKKRHAANLACVALVTARYGLWPPRA
jgi:hypothetical protein